MATKTKPVAKTAKLVFPGNAVLAIGYELTTAPKAAEQPLPEFQPDSRLKDPKKIAEDLRKKRESYLDNLPRTPLTGTFSKIVVAALGTDSLTVPIKGFQSDDDDQALIQFCQWMCEQFPRSFAEKLTFGLHPDPEVFIVAFEPRLFLKMLGLRAAIIDQACPAGLWYRNSNHFDFRDMVMPKEFSDVLGSRAWQQAAGLLLAGQLENYEPGRNAMIDATIIAEGIQALGLA